VLVSRAVFLALMAGCRENREAALQLGPDDVVTHADAADASVAPTVADAATSATTIDSLDFAGATAAEVVVGDVVAQLPSGRVRVTSAGRDKDAALSPDGRAIVFVRSRFDGNCAMPTSERGCSQCEELWIVRSGSAPSLLLRGERPDVPGVLEPRAGIRLPKFSPDGRRVYFSTAGGCTAGSIVARALDLSTMKETILVGEGVVDHEVTNGPFAGHLVIVRFAIEWDPITKASLGRKESWLLLTKEGARVRKLPDDETKRRAMLGE
jgi:dipeptidyl aminopeptidase/acylaminoacyl peptidase